MTAPAPATKPVHCKHECVCWMYRENKIPRDKKPCNRNMAGLPSCLSDTRRFRPAGQTRNKQDDCPHKELPIDPDEYKGTCELDQGDCMFPLKPKNWRDCTRLHMHQPPTPSADAVRELRELAAWIFSEYAGISPSDGQEIVAKIHDHIIDRMRELRQQHPNGKQDGEQG